MIAPDGAEALAAPLKESDRLLNSDIVHFVLRVY